MTTKRFARIKQADFEAELAVCLGRQCEVTTKEIALALAKYETVPGGLKRAIINALLERDPEYQIKLVRKKVGRPNMHDKIPESAEKVSQFVSDKMSLGLPQKAAVADACNEFRCSRATVYARMKEWKRALEKQIELNKLKVTRLEKPKKSGKFRSKNKRANRKGTRFGAKNSAHFSENRREARQLRIIRLSNKRSR